MKPVVMCQVVQSSPNEQNSGREGCAQEPFPSCISVYYCKLCVVAMVLLG